jgi:hypothetical protein
VARWLRSHATLETSSVSSWYLAGAALAAGHLALVPVLARPVGRIIANDQGRGGARLEEEAAAEANRNEMKTWLVMHGARLLLVDLPALWCCEFQFRFLVLGESMGGWMDGWMDDWVLMGLVQLLRGLRSPFGWELRVGFLLRGRDERVDWVGCCELRCGHVYDRSWAMGSTDQVLQYQGKARIWIIQIIKAVD